MNQSIHSHLYPHKNETFLIPLIGFITKSELKIQQNKKHSNKMTTTYATPVSTITAVHASVIQHTIPVHETDDSNHILAADIINIPQAQVVATTSAIPVVTQQIVRRPVQRSSSNPVQRLLSSSNPPKNCPDGGHWGHIHHIGKKTGALACIGCAVAGLFGVFFLACPIDRRDAYNYGGNLYNKKGKLIGNVDSHVFIPIQMRR